MTTGKWRSNEKPGRRLRVDRTKDDFHLRTSQWCSRLVKIESAQISPCAASLQTEILPLDYHGDMGKQAVQASPSLQIPNLEKDSNPTLTRVPPGFSSLS